MSGSWLDASRKNHVPCLIRLNTLVYMVAKGSPVAGEGEPQSTSSFATLPCITLANVLLVKVNHVAQRRFKSQRNWLHLLIDRVAKSHCKIVYSSVSLETEPIKPELCRAGWCAGNSSRFSRLWSWMDSSVGNLSLCSQGLWPFGWGLSLWKVIC